MVYGNGKPDCGRISNVGTICPKYENRVLSKSTHFESDGHMSEMQDPFLQWRSTGISSQFDAVGANIGVSPAEFQRQLKANGPAEVDSKLKILLKSALRSGTGTMIG